MVGIAISTALTWVVQIARLQYLTPTNTGSPTAIPRATHKATVRNAFVITLLHTIPTPIYAAR